LRERQYFDNVMETDQVRVLHFVLSTRHYL